MAKNFSERNPTTKRQAILLLSAGLFVIAFAQILMRYVSLPDMAIGALTGIGTGLLVLSLLMTCLKRAKQVFLY